MSFKTEISKRAPVLLAGLLLFFVAGLQAADVGVENEKDHPGATLPGKADADIELRTESGTLAPSPDGGEGSAGAPATESPTPSPTPEATVIPDPIPEVPTPAPVLTPARVTVPTPAAVPVIVPVTPSVSPTAAPPSDPGRGLPFETSGTFFPIHRQAPSHLWTSALGLFALAVLSALGLGVISWWKRVGAAKRRLALPSLGELGMSEAMQEELVRLIHSKSGLILAVGPASSGKTATLYSALRRIDVTKRTITTIEDPVEHKLEGVTQIPVNVQGGITCESCLSSLLRQDTDVIFVGEMRDIEALQIALHAAQSGRLLVSSLRTKDAVGTILRLEKMGIALSQISPALLMVIAQRLVRVLCPSCREAFSCTGEELRDVGLELPPGKTIYRAKGCAACQGTGYIGRTGIFEMLVFDEEMRKAASAGLDAAAICKLAREKGFQGYHQDGAQKILAGITSVEEILQTAQ